MESFARLGMASTDWVRDFVVGGLEERGCELVSRGSVSLEQWGTFPVKPEETTYVGEEVPTRIGKEGFEYVTRHGVMVIVENAPRT